MKNKVKINHLVQDQVPTYIRDTYPEFVEFLENYYTGLESPGGVLNLINNINEYTKLDNLADLVFFTELTTNVGFTTNKIEVTSTEGFPQRSGLIQINDELIYYKDKSETSFNNCSRGFSGITSYFDNDSRNVEFQNTLLDTHDSGEVVYNVHSLLLTELYKKYKRQYAPGFDDVQFYEEINEKNVVSRLKDFYSSKGSDASFRVLFKLIWGEEVKVVKPRDFLIQPSDADYRITRDLVVEKVLGNPQDLVNRTLFQDQTDVFERAAGTITDVQQIFKEGEEYFKLSLDYNPELETFTFPVHPKTRTTNPVGAGQTYLDVDSTLSFEDSGSLIYVDNDVRYEFTYTGKSSTQFFGLVAPVEIPLNSNIITPDYTYAITENNEEIRVRITGVLSDLEYDRVSSYYYSPGDQIQIVSLGTDSQDPVDTTWIINSTPEYEIESIAKVALKLNGAAQYRVKTFDENIFTLGDIGTISGSDGSQYDVFVIGVSDKNEFDINLTTQINSSLKYTIRKGVSKSKSITNPDINIISANIQNVYVDEDVEYKDTYVVSPSLPDYYNTPIDVEDLSVTFSGQYDGFDINIGTNAFITGDAVFYSYNNNFGLNIQEGQYFIYKVNASTIRLATSRSNIRNNTFVRVFGTVNNNKLELLRNSGRRLQSQNIIRKFTKPQDASSIEELKTIPGSTGMFVNGVELLNYRSSDAIFYGPINEIEISSGGDDYDVINPPVLEILDSTPDPTTVGFGTGAEAVCNVTGSLSRIDIIDKGFDYSEEPKVTISGGNGNGALAKCKLTKITHSVSFNAGSLYENVNISTNTITFNNDHRFRNFERVIYSTREQLSIGGLIDASIYYVRTSDNRTINLHNTADDAIVGINTINFTSYGDGLQSIASFEKKNVVSSIEVVDPGSGYSNKTIFFDSENINLHNNTMVYKNHGYGEKEVIRFNSDGTLPTGISSTSEYYTSIVSKDEFRIAKIEDGSSLSEDFNYVNRRFVDLVDFGLGKHNIKYRPIKVELEAPIGITTSAGQNFFARISPVFSGQITSISIKNKGNNYGSPTTLNYNRQPEFKLINGSLAQLSPIVSSAGVLIGVIINNGGKEYNSPPKIDIIGDGSGAIVTPIVENGVLVDTIIIDGGSGYRQVTTTINVVPSGSGAAFIAKINQFTINLVERTIQANKINSDDGFVYPALTSDQGLQYGHAYASRELRRKILSTSIDNDGNIIYRDDIDNDTNSLKYHSPIIGWSYDGHPIYGPYGYANKEGGAVKRLESGYSLSLRPNRPPTSEFPPGLFVEDYTFVGDGDLDERNGRFCKTPDYPNGVYAYFCTLNSVPEASGPLNGYLKPIFPYVIGNEFKSKPTDYNFSQFSSLKYNALNIDKWVRYTGHLGLLANRTKYSGFIQPDRFSEGFTEVETVTVGGVTDLKIVSPGDNYSISDAVFFNDENTGGSGAYARISRISGRDVNSIVYTFDKLEEVQFIPSGTDGRFVGFGSTSHGFNTGDIISIQNVNILSTEFAGNYTVGVSTNKLNISRSIGDSSVTGIITYLNVTGNLLFPTTSVNDLYLADNEIIKILNINTKDSVIKVQRSINGITTSFSGGLELVEKPRKITINSGFNTTTEYQLDSEYYFDPRESTIIASENLVLYSNPVSPTFVTAWDYYTVGVGTGSIEYYATKAPNNSLQGAKVSFGSTTGASDGFGIEYGTVGLSADVYTTSVFLKGSAGGEQVYIILEDGLTFNSMLVTLTNDWRRYSFASTTSAGSYRVKIGTLGTQGLTLNSAPEVYVWGVQVELGALTSSYYTTSGSALTRSGRTSGVILLNNRGKSEKSLVRPIFNTFYLPGHPFKTGDEITYRVGLGGTGVTVSTGATSYALNDGATLYTAVYSDDSIGISTQKVGIGSTGGFVGVGSFALSLLDLVDYGTSEVNSFVTNKILTISGDVYKKTSTITTEVNHQLTDGDLVDIEVISGVSTSYKIIYDDVNRRVVVNPRFFVDSDVNTNNNSIRIPNHLFENGQKIIFNSSAAPVTLTNSKIYYVIIVDENTIQLSDFYYEKISSNKDISIIQIDSQFSGSISPVNPELKVVRNSTVVFDLSDQTLIANSIPAFKFSLFSDSNLSTEFFTGKNSQTSNFNVKTTGVLGDPGAKLELIIDDNVPDSLFYTLTPIKYNGAAASKVEIVVDDFNIYNNNTISVTNSKYNAKAINVSGVTTNTFNYTLLSTPEKNSYSNTEAIISYSTDSTTAIGPIKQVTLDSIGRGYRSLPFVNEIVSGLGTNAIFLPASNELGKVDSTILTDIGFDYPSDQTLRPIAEFPYTYKIEPLSKFQQIKIVNPGINYFIPPQLVVLDGFTGRVNTEVSLEYEIGDTEVTIIRNTTGLYNVTPKIIPVNNPNGLRIDNITFDSVTKNVVIGFAVTFSSLDDYPFRIGDKVIVENTNIDGVIAGKGYNSATYGYALFTVVDLDVNVGGDFPTITYNLSDYLKPGEVPGNFDSFDSFGTVTPEPYFPTFDIEIAKDSFRRGEKITSQDDNIGIVQEYNFRNEYLKVRSKIPFKVDDLIIGESSQNKGIISSVEGTPGKYKLGSNSITKKGFLRDTGKLNRSFQRVHDNDYYQYFSYSIRSPIDYNDWNPLVSNLNHTAGFKKFSELVIDSYDPSIVGMSTAQDLNTVIAISDLTRVVDLNTVKDFDIGREKTIAVDNNLVSNEILFNLPFLARYQEFIGNRVLTIDDFSDQFDGNTRGFEIKTSNNSVFEIVFDGSDSQLVDLGTNEINLNNHYFVSGEVIEYVPPGNDPANSILITPTDFGPGIGTTTVLPSRITIIKQDNQKVRVATSATNALLFNPIGVGFTSVGIGSTHIFRSLNPNNRLLVTINGTIQSPMVGSAYTTALSSSVGVGTTVINVVGITSIFGGDLIEIDDEVMLVAGVDKNANTITVRRGWMGTEDSSHTSNTIVTKQIGNYNVLRNDIHFIEGPWGNSPVGFGTTATSAGDVDYSGLTTSSRFSGRIFLRSALNQGFTTVFTDAYDNNYVYDDISDQFNGINTSFFLKYRGNDIDNVFASNTIILIDDIFQGPQRLGNVLTNIEGDYKLESGGGQLLLGFNGDVTDPTLHDDINVNRVPKGGVIVDVGSLNGYGYQPLVSAGGTALVSAAGTISNISIGNSGSGYRSGLQTVGVGIQTESFVEANITPIGIATVLDGHVIGVAITNPKVFYAPREISNVGYSSITGVTTVITSTPHNLSLGDQVKIVGAAFTCDYYPPLNVENAIYDINSGITTVTVGGATTLTVNGFIYDNISGLATITTLEPHKIVPQTSIGRSFSLAGLALTCVGYGQTFGVYDFLYDNTTGLATVFTVGDHGLSNGETFKMRELTFSCPISGPTGYGQTFTITQFKYDNTTGLATVTTSTSITGVIGIGSDIRLDNLEFTCPFGSGITTSIFPDGTQGYTFTVTNVIASDQFELNVGISTIQHTYVENDAGQVTAGLTTSVFPDGTQGYFFDVVIVGTTTSFTVNVGPSTISHTYVSGGVIQVGINTNIFPGDATVSPLGDVFSVLSAPNMYTLTFNAGISTIPHEYVSGGSLTLGHKLKVGTDVMLTGVGFTDSNLISVSYPRQEDEIYCGTQVTKLNTLFEFEINAGIGTTELYYTSNGIVEEVIIAPRQINNSPTGQDPIADKTGIVKIIDEYSFIINSGSSPYTHFYKRCGNVEIPLKVIFDDPLSYYNIPLVYSSSNTGFGTGATVDIVVGQGSSVVNFEISNFGYGYGTGEILTFGIGGTVGIPTTGSINYSEFQLIVNSTFQSKFSGWNVGEFIVLDRIDQFFNGQRRLFPLSVNGDSISFFARANSGINLQSNLLVFVNDILQTPGEGYQFTGGSTLRFTEAPKGGTLGFSTTGDTAKIFMYTGTQTIDVQTVDVLPSVEVGDEVQLYSNENLTFTQDPRLVIDIKAADKVITNNYAGQGVTLNELFERPLTWTKQSVDKIIDNNFIGKDRVYYEPVINPVTNIITDVGVAKSFVYVNSIRPLFDDQYEGIGVRERSIVELISQERLETATATAVVSAGGSVTNLLITNPGYGYTSSPEVTIQKPFSGGSQAIAGVTIGVGGSIVSATVSAGGTNYFYGPLKSMTVNQQGAGFPPIDTSTNTFVKARLKTETGEGRGATANIEISTLNFGVASVSVVDKGANYKAGDLLFVDTYDNVGLGTSFRGFALTSPIKFTVASVESPEVLIAPPKRRIEECPFVTYEGDYGIIVGVGTTVVGAGTSIGVELDLFVPMNYDIREKLSIFATGITTGDIFNILNTNFVSAAQTSLSSDGTVIGISTINSDLICECIDWYTKSSVVPPGITGLGHTVGLTTTVTTVVVKFVDAGANNVVGLATTSFYGNYTWGKVGLPVRTKPVEFLTQHNASQSGLSTNPIIRRKNPLRYLGYVS